MKMLLVTLSLMIGLSAGASTETRSFTYDGSQDHFQFSLRTEQTHTEYRYEQRRSYCYRQEVYYRTVCHPHPRGGRICQTTPYYRTISYPCMETVRIPYEVKDFDVDAKVNVSVENLTSHMANEKFKVTLNGDLISLSASGSKTFLILLKKSNVKSHVNGTHKMIDATYETKLIPAADVMKALEVNEMSLESSVLSFKTGPIEMRELIGFSLNVEKAPFIGSNTVLFDRELASSEILLNSSTYATSVDVNIKNLGISFESGRYKLTAKTFLKYQGKLLNSSDFEHLEASRTLVYKIR